MHLFVLTLFVLDDDAVVFVETMVFFLLGLLEQTRVFFGLSIVEKRYWLTK